MLFGTTSKPTQYNDWQTHFEDCPYCEAGNPCSSGKLIQERLRQESELAEKK